MKVSTNEKYIVSILETGMMIDQQVQNALKGFKVTHAQYNVLRILNGSFPNALCMTEIKNRMIIPNADLTRLIDRLTIKNLVMRGECPENRRKVNVMISPQGQELLIEAWPVIRMNLNNFFIEEISLEEDDSSLSALSKLNNGLKQLVNA